MSHQGDFKDVVVRKSLKIRQFGVGNGTVTIQEHRYGEYLECSVADKPFFSVLAHMDQWGTWYTLKLGNEEYEYPQEWGTASFLKALGVSLLDMAEKVEDTFIT